MLNELPKFAFFTGKGGVGKTSLACAMAVELADQGKRVLLVSTDPASNVGQVFGQPIGNRVTALQPFSSLDALEIDPEAAAEEYRERIIGPLRDTLPEKALAGITEQLSGACTTEIAAFDEFTRLLTDPELAQRYDHVVFDTAPTGHTLRLLQLPGAWSDFLETGQGDASCLGPMAGLEQQRERYAAAVRDLSRAELTRIILVARPQQSALAEAARTSGELAKLGVANQHLAVNGLMPEVTSGDPLAEALAERDRAALEGMDERLKALPGHQFMLLATNLVGVEALRALMHPQDAVAAAPDAEARASIHWKLPALKDLTDELAAPGKGLIMVMGKGGVGKTTVAAATAVDLARRGHDVHLTTTDPAAHLEQTLAEEVESLKVTRIDPVEATARYRERVMATRGKDLDAQGRALLEEDLRSPCTEEIAVFQAFSSVIREASRRFVVVDTAPTGHTLLLLDATGAYHRDVIRQMGDNGPRAITPMMRLQDPELTRMLIVTLPETTPVLEAERLQGDLRRAGIEPYAWVVNASLCAAQSLDPLLRKRASAEQQPLEKVRNELSSRMAVIPMLAEEPIGASRLQAISGNDRSHEAA